MTKRKGTPYALSAIAAVTLAACGTSSASHVVGGAGQPVATSTATSTAVTTTTPSVTPVVPSTTAPTDALSSQTLDQVGAELGSLDNSLNTADADLNNPQGDS